MKAVFYGRNGSYSRSYNAEVAEDEGRLPLTRAIQEVRAQAGCTAKEARAALVATFDGEWHHVSKYANRVNYYSVQAAVDHLRPEAALAARIEAYRQELIGQRDCTVPVRRHSGREKWLAFSRRLCDQAGLDAEARTDVPVAYGDVPALRAAIAAAAEKHAERLAAAAERNREYEAASRRLDALLQNGTKEQDADGREITVFASGVAVMVHSGGVNIYENAAPSLRFAWIGREHKLVPRWTATPTDMRVPIEVAADRISQRICRVVPVVPTSETIIGMSNSEFRTRFGFAMTCVRRRELLASAAAGDEQSQITVAWMEAALR